MTEHDRRDFHALFRSRAGVVLLGFLAVAGYFLWQEHAAHLRGYVPLLLLLGLCVGMHFFMHGGHGGGHGSSGQGNGEGDR